MDAYLRGELDTTEAVKRNEDSNIEKSSGGRDEAGLKGVKQQGLYIVVTELNREFTAK